MAAAVAGKVTVRRNILIVAGVLAVFVCGCVMLLLSQGQSKDEVTKTTEGKVVCLSKTGPGPHTMEWCHRTRDRRRLLYAQRHE